MPREATLAGRLAALGFADTAGAERLISELGLDIGGADAELIAAMAAAPDPDLALAGLAALPGPPAGLIAALRADGDLRTRLTAVLGASPALAYHLRRHPDDWRLLACPGVTGRRSRPRPCSRRPARATRTPTPTRVPTRATTSARLTPCGSPTGAACSRSRPAT